MDREYKNTHKKIKMDLNNIISEYCYKRNSFNPSKPSPNVFINKLHYRMKQYYSYLYKPFNLSKK